MTEDQKPKKSEPKTEGMEEQLRAEKRRSEDYLTRLKYLQADFENLRKRCDRQIAEVSQYSNERLIIQLLEVVDELELALRNANTPNASVQVLVEGVEMTLKRLRKVLEQEGVTPIESQGKLFDPSKHNAIASEEREDVKECVVVEEVRKGYMMKGKVIRPSVVKVAVKKSHPNEEKKENESI